MASRTSQKEQARARRIAAEHARAQQQHRTQRLQLIGGVVLVALAVVAVAIAISARGGSSGSGLQTGTKAAGTVSAVSQLLSGTTQSGAVLGNPKAPVTMTYYGDLECPVCSDFTLSGGFPQLVANDVKAGRVKVVYRSFQTATPDPQTFDTQQAAALAAGEQNRFWNFVELFYREQGQEGSGYVTSSYLLGLAKQVPGLNLSQWQSSRSASSLAAQVRAEGQTGKSIGVNATPAFVFQGPKGTTTPTAGVLSYSDLESAITRVA